MSDIQGVAMWECRINSQYANPHVLPETMQDDESKLASQGRNDRTADIAKSETLPIQGQGDDSSALNDQESTFQDDLLNLDGRGPADSGAPPISAEGIEKKSTLSQATDLTPVLQEAEIYGKETAGEKLSQPGSDKQPAAETPKAQTIDQGVVETLKPAECGVRVNSPGTAKLIKSRIRLPNYTLSRENKGVPLPLDKGNPQWTDIRAWGRIERTEKGWSLFPDEPGEFWFNADYSDGSSVRFDIIVNQDPRKLWLVKEPEDRTFEKPHTATLHHEWKDFQVAGASRRGRSHEHSGSFRDDDMGVWADEATGRYVFIVADGAGSAKYSREGSRRAIEEVLAKLDANLTVQLWESDGDNLPRDGQIAKKLCGLGLFANERLKSFVESENQKHPDDKYEIKNFNTTFLIVAAKKDQDGSVRLVSFSVGDGAIAWYTGSDFGLMCSPDGGEYSGGTRFLTTESVWKKAREDWTAFCHARVFTRKIAAADVGRLAIFLMTDGVSDPMFETDANLQNLVKWQHLAENELKGQGDEQAKILDSDTAETKANKMLEWLNFWSVGNHDDRTIIAVYPQIGDVKEAK